MLIQVLFICLLPNILLAESAASVTASVFLPKSVSPEAYNEQMNKYWTSERLQAAKPLDIILPSLKSKTASGDSEVSTGPASSVPGSIPSTSGMTGKAISPNGRQIATTGRVFWDVGGSSYSCSAAVVSSDSTDLVATAAHCVYDTASKTWYNNNNWVFIPAFSNYNKPYGTWPARNMIVLQAWTTSTDYNYDVAFVAVGKVNGQHIQALVGSQGIGFNYPRLAYTYSFGYPINLGNGLYLQSCNGTVRASRYTQNKYVGQELACGMTQGCSGGPWLQNVVDATGIGYVTSVNSFLVTNIPGYMHGPYFDSNTKLLYDDAKVL